MKRRPPPHKKMEFTVSARLDLNVKKYNQKKQILVGKGGLMQAASDWPVGFLAQHQYSSNGVWSMVLVNYCRLELSFKSKITIS